jgi:lactoylglutathione lyase
MRGRKAMRLFIELFVDDMERSITFYRDVIGMQLVSNSPDYTEFHLGEIEISMSPFSNLDQGHYLVEKPRERMGNRVEFCLEVDDFEQVHERVKKLGVPIKDPIAKRPWGAIDFRIVDPNGLYLRITKPAT